MTEKEQIAELLAIIDGFDLRLKNERAKALREMREALESPLSSLGDYLTLAEHQQPESNTLKLAQVNYRLIFKRLNSRK